MNYDNYRSAQKLGKKAVQTSVSEGHPETLPALDDILQHAEIQAEVPLGLVDIPADLIVGTRTAGRSSAFAPNFMPILDERSEFAAKWIYLYDSHLSEGIREPVTAYEYLNRYYVQEGNKRVSVLKFCGAATIPGYVTRLIPVRSNDPEIQNYYEFLDFYNVSNINYLIFSKPGRYQRLYSLIGKRQHERWSDEDRINFRSVFSRFRSAYEELGGTELHNITSGDALLVYIDVFGYQQTTSETPAQIEKNLEKIWEEILLLENNQEVDVKLDPAAVPEPRKKLFNRLLAPSEESKHYTIGFIHAKTAETSSWTYGHELGRLYLHDEFHDRLETKAYDNVTSDTALETIEKAIRDGCQIIFTTTPEFQEASLKAAINHPEVKILNCSLNASHKYIRTYYGRMYEAKFLTGVLAGTMTDTDKIGYIADYPIYGMTANINAFALGVKMVNPDAKVYLEWSTARKNQNVNLTDYFMGIGANYISNQDMIIPNRASRQFGLYRVTGELPVNLACPVWHWGKYYERIIRSIKSGVWNQEGKTDVEKALNYWWGMSAGVIDIIWSPAIPSGTKQLLEILRQAICNCSFSPFSGVICSQTGIIQQNDNASLAPKDIITMNWLSDNIIGQIPTLDELKDESRKVVELEGTNKEEV